MLSGPIAPRTRRRFAPISYRRDVPGASVHVLDAGHFALDTAASEIAGLVRGFMGGRP